MIGAPRVVDRRRTVLYGRTTEVRRLLDLLDGVEAAGGALVVRSEAGIGKSALLAGACRLAATAPKDGQL
jgi:hypothetical protein